MKRYGNLSGNSGVTRFEIGRDSIVVEFQGVLYLYTNESAGKANVERMKALARAGSGLSGFISRHVRKQYAAKQPSSGWHGWRPGRRESRRF
jgi:hypothetical protein